MSLLFSYNSITYKVVSYFLEENKSFKGMRSIGLCLATFGLIQCTIANIIQVEPELPEWSPTYSVSGMLSIPYAEIEEPFTAYADLQNGKSRIDYYGGVDKTYQRADIGAHGLMFKVVPMTNELVTNQINCYQAGGSQDSPVETQSILPNLEGFTLKLRLPGCTRKSGDVVLPRKPGSPVDACVVP